MVNRTYTFNYSDYDVDKIVSRQRIMISPVFVIRENGIVGRRNVVFDTGATEITLPATLIGFNNEDEFLRAHKTRKVMRSGIVSTAHVVYYAYNINEIRLDDIVLRDFPVSITFDKRVNIALFGMSVIGLFETHINPLTCTISLTETDELTYYTHNNLSLANALSLCKNEFIDFSNETVTAHYINNLAKHPTD